MAWEARQARRNHSVPSLAEPVAHESDLHDQIIAECKRRGWKYVHSRMDRKTTVGEGVCDFIIYADGGKMFHVECKALKGKLSMEQLAFIAWVEKLGHKVHVVTSFGEFLEVAK
ncbi:MAG: VRR-NUC domain-containing protein [Patescibacteria group bacterium]|nr:VRR-NUC domain-containing protein [Patescibacteria group bacterium]